MKHLRLSKFSLVVISILIAFFCMPKIYAYYQLNDSETVAVTTKPLNLTETVSGSTFTENGNHVVVIPVELSNTSEFPIAYTITLSNSNLTFEGGSTTYTGTIQSNTNSTVNLNIVQITQIPTETTNIIVNLNTPYSREDTLGPFTINYVYDNNGPVCTWGNWSEPYLGIGETATITLTCTDASGVSTTTFTPAMSDSTAGTLSAPLLGGTSTARTFTFTLTAGNVATSTTLTLPADTIEDIYGNYAASVTSPAINTGILVTFYPNGGTIPSGADWTGSGALATKLVHYNETYGTLPVPTKSGYVFLGWSKSSTDNVPAEYQEVEYIQSSGTQYIDTGLKGQLDFEIDFQALNASDTNGDAYYFGQRQNGSTIRFALIKYNDNFHLMTGSNGMWNGSFDTNRHMVNFTSSGATIDGVTYSVDWGTGSAGTTLNFLLFAANYNGTMKYNGGMRIYSAKFYQSSTLVRDLVPCYRISDGVAGMYDKVNSVFYTNAGTGTFSIGNVAIKDEVTSSSTVDVNANHTLYAKWVEGITVTFDANGGSVSPLSKDVAYGDTYGELPEPTKAGYMFLGWSTTPYPQLAYLESTGTQFINTSYNASKNIGVVVDYQYTSTNTSGQQALFGTQNSNAIFYRFYLNGSNQWAYAFNNAEGNWISTEVSANTSRHTLQFNRSNKVRIDSSTYNADIRGTVSKTSTNPLCIFANNNAGSPAMYSRVKIYSFKMYNNSSGALVRDYIPAYRGSDGVAGLYDKVNSVFYTNAGTGVFNKGDFVNPYTTDSTTVTVNADHTLYAIWIESATVTFNPSGGTVDPTSKSVMVNETYGTLPTPTKEGYTFVGWAKESTTVPTGYQKLTYIESTGTQYIDTGYYANPNTGVETNVQFTDLTVQQRVFGADNNDSTDVNYSVYINGSGNWAYSFKTGTGNWKSTGVTVNTSRHTIEMNRGGKFKIDSTTYNQNMDGGVTSTSNYTMLIFASHMFDNIAHWAKLRVYYFKIYEGNTLVKDLIPVYRMADGAMGLYDQQNDAYYFNAGRGKFKKGSFSDGLITSSTVVTDGSDHTLYAIWAPEDSTPTCTVTTPSGFDTSKELTINATAHGGVALEAEPYSWNNSTWTSTNTRTVSAKGTYTAYVMNVDGEVGTCSLYIKDQKQYKRRTCNVSVTYGSWGNDTYTVDEGCSGFTYETSKVTCETAYRMRMTTISQTDGTANTTYGGWGTRLDFCQNDCNGFTSSCPGGHSCSCTCVTANYTRHLQTRSCSCSSWGSWSGWGTTVYSDTCSQDADDRTVYGP